MEWISVKDGLPDNQQWVRVCVDTERGFEEMLMAHQFDTEYAGLKNCFTPYGSPFPDEYLKITHWMPLSAPEKKKLVWQSSTLQQPDVWTDRSDEEYELMNHLSRFNWRQI